MTRISVTDDEGVFVGWFDATRADRIASGTRWDGQNVVPVATGSPWIDETLWKTAQGRWVLNRDASRYHNGGDTYRYISDDEARTWMLRCEVDDETIEEHFGTVEEEAEVGRPAIGPQVVVRMSVGLRDRIDARADAEGVTRAEWVRRVLEEAV